MMRDNKLDFYKGILIIGVVYGHILNLIKEGTALSFGLHTLIRTFDMPCFMLIAGYLLSKSVEKYKCIPYIANKTTNLALPLVLWGGVYYVLIGILYRSFSIVNIAKSLASYWFIWATLVLSVCFILINCIQSRRMQVIVGALVLLFFHCIPEKYDLWNLSYVCPFFMIGFFNSKICVPNSIKKRKILIVPVFILLFCFWKTNYTIWNSSGFLFTSDALRRILIVVFRFFIGLTGCISFKIVMDLIYSTANWKWIENIGKTTLINYIWHPIFLAAVVRRLLNWFGLLPVFTWNLKLTEFILAPAIAVLISWAVCVVVEKMRLIPRIGKYLFGFNLCNARKVKE